MSLPPNASFTPAQRHRRVRRQHTDELAEDYVEAIQRKLEETGVARVMDLAAGFGVSHVSVIRALRRLDAQGLVVYARGGGAVLTERGAAIARTAIERHDLLVRFFRALGVSEVQADADAEGTEHHLSLETLEAIRGFLGRRDA